MTSEPSAPDWTLTPPPELVERLITYVQTERTDLWNQLLASETAGNDLDEIAPALVRAIKDVFLEANSIQIPTLLLSMRIKAVEVLTGTKGPSL